MRFGTVFQILFILYCVEAGVLYLIIPWTPAWDRMVLHWPAIRLHLVALHPLFRGAVSGFGLIHLIWGGHDLDAWLARRQSGH